MSTVFASEVNHPCVRSASLRNTRSARASSNVPLPSRSSPYPLGFRGGEQGEQVCQARVTPVNQRGEGAAAGIAKYAQIRSSDAPGDLLTTMLDERSDSIPVAFVNVGIIEQSPLPFEFVIHSAGIVNADYAFLISPQMLRTTVPFMRQMFG